MQELLQLIMRADQATFLWINQLGSPWLDPPMIFFSWLGEGGYAGLILALFLLVFGKRSAKATGLLILAGLALSLILGILTLKPLIERARPFDVFPEVRVLAEAESYSFPSGHALAAMVVALIIWKRHPQWRWPLLILALLIGFSRIYNGVHFPTDVLGGFLLAALIDWTVLRLSSGLIRD